MKNENGQLEHYFPEELNCTYNFIDGSISCDIPTKRLGELFNVNTYIVAQVNPHGIPYTWDLVCPADASELTKGYYLCKKLVYTEI